MAVAQTSAWPTAGPWSAPGRSPGQILASGAGRDVPDVARRRTVCVTVAGAAYNADKVMCRQNIEARKT